MDRSRSHATHIPEGENIPISPFPGQYQVSQGWNDSQVSNFVPSTGINAPQVGHHGAQENHAVYSGEYRGYYPVYENGWQPPLSAPAMLDGSRPSGYWTPVAHQRHDAPGAFQTAQGIAPYHQPQQNPPQPSQRQEQVPYHHTIPKEIRSAPPGHQQQHIPEAKAHPAGGNTSYSFQPIQTQPPQSSTGSPEVTFNKEASKRARRAFGQIERIYKCGWGDCDKAYGTLNHLNTHVALQNHGPRRTAEEFKYIRMEWKARNGSKTKGRKPGDEIQFEEYQTNQPTSSGGKRAPAPWPGYYNDSYSK